jgi:hypothetical protein
MRKRRKVTEAWREREREDENRRELSRGLQMKTAQGEQTMNHFPRSEGIFNSHGFITNDPYDLKSHIRILELLNDVWQRSQRTPRAAFHIAPPGIIQPNPAYYMPNPSGRF